MAKPSTSATIDFGHAAAQGLMTSLPFNEAAGQPQDRAGSNHGTMLSGASWSTYNGEPCIDLAIGSGGVDVGTSDWLPTGSMTIIVGYGKRDSTNRQSGAFGFIDNSGPFQPNRAGIHAPWNDGNLYADLPLSARVTATGLTIGAYTTIAMTAATDGSHKLYVGGTLRGSASYPGRTAFTGPQRWGLGRHAGFAADLARLLFVHVYNRELPASEVSSRHADPFPMYVEPPSVSVAAAVIASRRAGGWI